MVAQTVANRLLHEPTRGLKSIHSGGESQGHAQALLEVFGLDPTAPTPYSYQRPRASPRAQPQSSDRARYAAHS
jgi:hypothetical protein